METVVLKVTKGPGKGVLRVKGLVWFLNMAQKPYTVWPLGPKASIYESLEP